MTFDDIWRHLMSGRGNVGGSFKNSRYFWHSAWGHTLEHCPVRCIACHRWCMTRMQYHSCMCNAIYAAWQSCITEHIASVQCSMGYIELHITWMQCPLYGNTLRQPALHWCNMVCNVFMQTGKQCVIAIYQRMHCRVMKRKNPDRYETSHTL